MSWEKTTVGEIVTTRKGYAFKSSKYVNKGVPVVRVSDYTMDSISDADLKYYPYDEKQNYIFKLYVEDYSEFMPRKDKTRNRYYNESGFVQT